MKVLKKITRWMIYVTLLLFITAIIINPLGVVIGKILIDLDLIIKLLGVSLILIIIDVLFDLIEIFKDKRISSKRTFIWLWKIIEILMIILSFVAFYLNNMVFLKSASYTLILITFVEQVISGKLKKNEK
jgi:hypothetical protein